MIKKVDQEDSDIPLDPEKICQYTPSSHYMLYLFTMLSSVLRQCRNLKSESSGYKKLSS